MIIANLLSALPGAVSQGLIWGIMAIGVFITFKILDIADLTVDGTLCTGAAVCVVLLIGGCPMWLAILLATLAGMLAGLATGIFHTVFGIPAILAGILTQLVLLIGGCPMWLAILLATLAGMLAGLATGIFHTVFGIPAILAGILTQFALWSVNLRILGGANQAISADKYNLLTSLRYLSNPDIPFWKNPLIMITVFLIVVIALLYWFFGTEMGCSLRATGANQNMARAQGINTNFTKVMGLMVSNGLVALLYWFFGTEMGCSLRATGANQNMARAQGINTNFTKVMGLMVSNGLVGLSGALLAQYQGFADINMGRGAIVIGLAAVVIGEVLFSKIFRNFALRLLSVALGSIIYYVVIQVILWTRLIDANDLKLLSALVVALFLALPYWKSKYFSKALKKGDAKHA